MVHVAFQVWWLFQNSDKLQVSTPRGTIQTRPDRGKTSAWIMECCRFLPCTDRFDVVTVRFAGGGAAPAPAAENLGSASRIRGASTAPRARSGSGPVGRVGRRSPPAFPRLIRRSTTGSRSGSVKVYSIKPGRSRFGRSGSIVPRRCGEGPRSTVRPHTAVTVTDTNGPKGPG